MQLSIVSASRAPLRAEKSGASEMISELIFGEAVEVLDKDNTWLKVRNLYDNYTGWADIRLFEPINGYTPQDLLTGKLGINLILPVYRLDPNYGMKVQILGINAFFPDTLLSTQDEDSLKYQFGEIEFFVGKDLIETPKAFERDNLLEMAEWFLNVPYYWGGRSSCGIDCSGLLQQVFRACGNSLPRDAKDQALTGKKIKFDEIKAGDIAFFSNSDGNIVHTGICTGENEIIHASGFVKTDELRPDGIYDQQLGKITHVLAHINTYFTDC
jgi:hypothetical protein